MRWKKKSGAYRASIPGCQFRIKADDNGDYDLMINTDETGWMHADIYTDVAAAKLAADGLVPVVAEAILAKQQYYEEFRKKAEERANEGSDVKSVRKLVKTILKMPKHTRKYAYDRLGDSASIFKELVDDIESGEKVLK